MSAHKIWHRRCPRCGGLEKCTRIDAHNNQVWCIECGRVEVIENKGRTKT